MRTNLVIACAILCTFTFFTGLAAAVDIGAGKVVSVSGGSCINGPYLHGGSDVSNWDVHPGDSYTIVVQGIPKSPGFYVRGKKTYTPNCTNPTLTVKNSASGNVTVNGTCVANLSDPTTQDCTYTNVTVNATACETMPIVYSCPTTVTDNVVGTTLSPTTTTYFAQGSVGGQTHLVATTTCQKDVITCGPPCDPATQDCGGGQDFHLTVCKWYDTNTNGTNDGEPAIENWQVKIDGEVFYTPANGCFTKTFATTGLHTVQEVLPIAPPQWYQTGLVVNGVTQTVGLETQVNVTGNNEVDFGNVCLGTGGALTLGFWANSNGAKVLCGGKQGSTTIPACTGWQALLNSSNLVDAKGNLFQIDLSASCSKQASALASFLNGANATNMANMLSAQLAAMQLNIQCPSPVYSTGGPTNPGMYLQSGPAPADCPAIDYVSSAGFVNLGDLIADSIAELAAPGGNLTTVKANPTERVCQDWKKTTLDSGNNNIGFVQASGSCRISY